MSLSYLSEVPGDRSKASFRLFVQIVRNLSERNSQRMQKKDVFEQNKRGKVRQPSGYQRPKGLGTGLFVGREGVFLRTEGTGACSEERHADI